MRVLPVGVLLILASGCDEQEGAMEGGGAAVVAARGALLNGGLEVQTEYDSFAAPVHVQIRACTTPNAANEQLEIDCVVDPEYALVGGGANASSAGSNPGSPFLTESRPFDDRTWRASSSDHIIANAHYLTVFAIGMRLDGVNTQTLRESINRKEVRVDGDVAAAQISLGSVLLSGGARTTPSESAGDNNRFLKSTIPSAYHEWRASSDDHLLPAEGSTTVWLLEVENSVIEGFGMLEIKQLQAPSDYTAGGFSTSSVQVEPGWALIGMGASIVDDPNQEGRMFVGIRPGDDSRSVVATSREQIVLSAGATTAYAVQARRRPGSHGLCNEGAPLDMWMEGCVTQICSQRSSCCSTAWDDTCIGMVESVCGRSCEGHTCVRSEYEPERWEYADGSVIESNCYYYSRNKYPDGSATFWPGMTLNLREDDSKSYQRFIGLTAGEGLIPIEAHESCTENRTKVYYSANYRNWHYIRQDASGDWSEKYGPSGYVTDVPPPDPDNDDNPYKAFFCACNQPLPSELPE
jgi:hypothetical protein